MVRTPYKIKIDTNHRTVYKDGDRYVVKLHGEIVDVTAEMDGRNERIKRYHKRSEKEPL